MNEHTFDSEMNEMFPRNLSQFQGKPLKNEFFKFENSFLNGNIFFNGRHWCTLSSLIISSLGKKFETFSCGTLDSLGGPFLFELN